MTETNGTMRRDGRHRTAQRVSTQDALERLSKMQVRRSYRAPRGNQEVDRAAMELSLGRLEQVVR
jgi:hypothetical protein